SQRDRRGRAHLDGWPEQVVSQLRRKLLFRERGKPSAVGTQNGELPLHLETQVAPDQVGQSGATGGGISGLPDPLRQVACTYAHGAATKAEELAPVLVVFEREPPAWRGKSCAAGFIVAESGRNQIARLFASSAVRPKLHVFERLLCASEVLGDFLRAVVFLG